jgi:murein hydrolase activator
MTFLMLLFLNSANAQDEERDARREVARTDREERRLLDELNDIDQELFNVTAEIEELQNSEDDIEQQRLMNEDALVRAQAELDGRGDKVSGLVKVLYHINKRGFARIVFSAEDPVELRRTTRYILYLLKFGDDELGDFREQVELKEAAVERVDIDRESLAALQAEVRLKEARLRDDKARRMNLLTEVRDDRQTALQLIGERTRAVSDMGESVTLMNANVTNCGSFRAEYGKLRWPVGGTILRAYGDYTDPKTSQPAFNAGLQIAASQHTPVRAVGCGEIVHVGWIRGYGLTVIVDHSDEFKTVYSHLGQTKVRVGAAVDRGDVLGTVGETAVTDDHGPRLGFEVRKGAGTQDPAGWLGAR